MNPAPLKTKNRGKLSDNGGRGGERKNHDSSRMGKEEVSDDRYDIYFVDPLAHPAKSPDKCHAFINASQEWNWQKALQLMQAARKPADGPYTWIWQTASRLREAGFQCSLVPFFPEKGIVLAHASRIPPRLPLRRDRFIISVRSDKPEHFGANAEIVQNPTQATAVGWQRKYFVPFFPQPELIRRSVERGDRYENVYYIGRRWHLHPELLSETFQRWCSDQGLKFVPCVEPTQWCDYRLADVVVALRPRRGPHANKPASKLVNCWHAGVPAILGDEIAFQMLRRSDLDFIEAATPQQVREALIRLKTDPQLRQRLMENGQMRAVDYTHEAITKHWIDLLSGPVTRDAREWFDSPTKRLKTYARRFAKRADKAVRFSFVGR